MKLQIKDLKFAYNPSNPVLRGVDMEASPGGITALVGPNASGKSTLLKCMAGILKPRGDILLDGENLGKFKKRDLAKKVSYLPQESSSRALITVFEAVLLGRLQTLSWRVGEEDLNLALKALQNLEIDDLATRYLDELSGGQKQMVSIAQAIVREPKVFLLDELTSNLDLRHELEILDLITDISAEKDITTVIVLHDLNLAARYADSIVVLKEGKVFASGKADNVLTPEMLRSVYGVEARVKSDDGILQVTPISSISNEGRHVQGVHQS